MREAIDSIIEIEDVSSTTFSLLLDYIYTDKVTLNHENVVDVLIAAKGKPRSPKRSNYLFRISSAKTGSRV
jgi:hypothetical protein